MFATHFRQELPIHDSMPKCLMDCTFAARWCATIIGVTRRDASQGLHVPFDGIGRLHPTSGASEGKFRTGERHAGCTVG